MNGDFISLTNDALWLVLILSAPPIIVASVAGLLVAIVQAATQIQEQTLSFVPKMIAVSIALLVSGNWVLNEMVSFTHTLFDMLPALLGRT